MSKLFDTLVAGGVTIIPLLLCSFIVVSLAIERSIFWSRIRKQQKRVVRTALQIYQEDSAQAEDFLQKYTDLPIARIYLEALLIPNATPAEFGMALDSRTQSEIPHLKRFNNIFEIIVGLAPLLGLLGTVTGLIASFGSLTLGDVGGSKALNVTGGISEALISTATGLTVAVIALVAASIFRSLYAQQVAYFDECCTQIELQHLRSQRQANQQVNAHV
jgi:biopolymer transport protein ExbB